MTQEDYMLIAIHEARKGCGWTNPNPMVGAVIVKEGKIIGKGFHEKYGEWHAERNAIANCIESPEGAALYVTLEPCCHYGNTPPCTDAIIESGISSVVIGSADPNPLVAGKGMAALEQHNISMTSGILEQQCDDLNRVFFHYIKTKQPYVVMKYAMTADGKIATRTGKSKWITGESAREQVHRDRHRYAAIMVGINTVLTDNPLLNCRLPNTKNPVRIICDTHLRTPLNSQVVMTAEEIPTYIATTCLETERQRPYLERNCHIIPLTSLDGHMNLKELMYKLGEMKIDSILLEGGGTLNYSALQAGIVNQVQAYIAPKLFGGENAKTAIAGIGVSSPEEAFHLTNPQIQILDQDILIQWEVKNHVHGNC